MKRLILLLISTVLFYGILTAQTPQAFKYQAVARNINGNLIQNQQVAFRIDILQGGPSGNLVYRERHTTLTNDYGLANLQIGNGIVLIGNFTAIDWSTGQMFMNIFFDPNGGYSFINMGTIELLSVPYALYADTCGSSVWTKTDDNLSYISGAVGIGTTQTDSSAIFEINSTDKGLLIPRMNNTQISEISNPVDGLMVYSTSDKSVYIFNDSIYAWMSPFSGAILPLRCGGLRPIRDYRDGKLYPTVQIGTQCWMKKNLNYGTTISTLTEMMDNGIDEKYCYNNIEDNCTEYGGLYNWNEMMQYSEPGDICPVGWRVPTDDDWCTLATFLDPSVNCDALETLMGTVAGGKLKETGTDHWDSPNTGATNESEFTGRGGGLIGIGSSALKQNGNFWSSSYYGEVGGYSQFLYWQLVQYSGQIARDKDNPGYGLSVRCIRDINGN